MVTASTTRPSTQKQNSIFFTCFNVLQSLFTLLSTSLRPGFYLCLVYQFFLFSLDLICILFILTCCQTICALSILRCNYFLSTDVFYCNLILLILLSEIALDRSILLYFKSRLYFCIFCFIPSSFFFN